MVAGLSNTGGDVAVEVCKTADTVYVSHRAGAAIVSLQIQLDSSQECKFI